MVRESENVERMPNVAEFIALIEAIGHGSVTAGAEARLR